MRKLDAVIQALLILLGIGIVFTSIFTWNMETIFLLLYLQLLLGPFQVLSALLNIIGLRRQEVWFQKRIKSYLGFVAINLTILLVLPLSFPWSPSYDDTIFFILAIFFPWCLAFYHLRTTWKKVQSTKVFNKGQRAFLPHVGF